MVQGPDTHEFSVTTITPAMQPVQMISLSSVRLFPCAILRICTCIRPLLESHPAIGLCLLDGFRSDAQGGWSGSSVGSDSRGGLVKKDRRERRLARKKGGRWIDADSRNVSGVVKRGLTCAMLCLERGMWATSDRQQWAKFDHSTLNPEISNMMV